MPMPAGGSEELLRAVFSVADTPSPEEIKALAWQTGCSRGHVRSFFGKLRSSVQVGSHLEHSGAGGDAAVIVT